MIAAIFAADLAGGMGRKGTLPWPHQPQDLKRFESITTNNIVVMGRRTWDDPKMPKPLKNRINYVVTNRPVDLALSLKGDIVDNLLRLENQYPDKKIFLIGGVNLLESAKPILDHVYLTYFKKQYIVDTKINLGNFLNGFIPTGAKAFPDLGITFVNYASLFKRSKTNIDPR
jgi:dihydrofolate reductase